MPCCAPVLDREEPKRHLHPIARASKIAIPGMNHDVSAHLRGIPPSHKVWYLWDMAKLKAQDQTSPMTIAGLGSAAN
ncbi:predicted protein [Plenodomus lingam JN3]|uniref:Predicted protein n=1 Tax=Leptosphaeria maculans (strain JN3 / isolate v23.1.3 / race Av1-4-5-6-7-8) TaxID=985895 RepID=E4ZPX3_LEPMJ|nr:predicted protein [Plenodomus lingam JN3]CBX93508.1 predicted protein [Plenodomus lingam JN3]